MNKCKILIAQGDINVMEQIEEFLVLSNYLVYCAKSGEQTLEEFYLRMPDVVLLDLQFADISGSNIIRKIREQSNAAIIVVSTVSIAEEVVMSLDLGADDFVQIPFNKSILLARIRTALRHSRINIETPYKYQMVYDAHGLYIDFSKRVVIQNGKLISLTRIEYKLVELLAQHQGKVLSYDYLMREIWGPPTGDGNRILRVNITNIRKKIEPDPKNPIYFMTEYGVGYRLIESER